MMPLYPATPFASIHSLTMMSIVGPIELFAFYGQHYGRERVLDAYRQSSRAEEARGSACEFLLVDGDRASALIRVTNIETRTGHEISFRVVALTNETPTYHVYRDRLSRLGGVPIAADFFGSTSSRDRSRLRTPTCERCGLRALEPSRFDCRWWRYKCHASCRRLRRQGVRGDPAEFVFAFTRIMHESRLALQSA